MWWKNLSIKLTSSRQFHGGIVVVQLGKNRRWLFISKLISNIQSLTALKPYRADDKNDPPLHFMQTRSNIQTPVGFYEPWFGFARQEKVIAGLQDSPQSECLSFLRKPSFPRNTVDQILPLFPPWAVSFWSSLRWSALFLFPFPLLNREDFISVQSSESLWLLQGTTETCPFAWMPDHFSVYSSIRGILR